MGRMATAYITIMYAVVWRCMEALLSVYSDVAIPVWSLMSMNALL